MRPTDEQVEEATRVVKDMAEKYGDTLPPMPEPARAMATAGTFRHEALSLTWQVKALGAKNRRLTAWSHQMETALRASGLPVPEMPEEEDEEEDEDAARGAEAQQESKQESKYDDEVGSANDERTERGRQEVGPAEGGNDGNSAVSSVRRESLSRRAKTQRKRIIYDFPPPSPPPSPFPSPSPPPSPSPSPSPPPSPSPSPSPESPKPKKRRAVAPKNKKDKAPAQATSKRRASKQLSAPKPAKKQKRKRQSTTETEDGADEVVENGGAEPEDDDEE